jgi:hypothetical protein
MPQWIHDRARHIQAKNPSMPEGEAFAIATQQAHSVGKSPKGYGTPQGRHEAKKKFDTPKDDTKTADPGDIGEKTAELLGQGTSHLAPYLNSFTDELVKIANLSGATGHKGTLNPTRAGALQGTSPVKVNSTPSVPVLTTPPMAPESKAAPSLSQAPPVKR